MRIHLKEQLIYGARKKAGRRLTKRTDEGKSIENMAGDIGKIGLSGVVCSFCFQFRHGEARKGMWLIWQSGGRFAAGNCRERGCPRVVLIYLY